MKKLPLTLGVMLCVPACSFGDTEDPGQGSGRGPVAERAAEAWPAPPAGVPSLSAQQILAACSRAGECSAEVMSATEATRTALVDLCVFDAVFSAERAIPLSGFNLANERAELWIQCVQSANDCAAVDTCRTARDPRIRCEEDGCYATEALTVSCNGSTATLTGASGTTTRDCSRAHAACDPNSETGCTDRHFSRCSENAPPVERCDGAIQLGCDTAGQVSYHDCTRLGGSCGLGPDGSEGCVYPHQGACALDDFGESSCESGMLRACVVGEALALPSALCVAN